MPALYVSGTEHLGHPTCYAAVLGRTVPGNMLTFSWLFFFSSQEA